MTPYARGSPYAPSVLTRSGPLRPCEGLTPVRSPTSHRPSPQGLRGRKGLGPAGRNEHRRPGANCRRQDRPGFPATKGGRARPPEKRLESHPRETRDGAGEPHTKTPFEWAEARLQPRCSPIPCTRPTEGEGSPWATPSRAPAGHPLLAAHSLALVARRTAGVPARAGFVGPLSPPSGWGFRLRRPRPARAQAGCPYPPTAGTPLLAGLVPGPLPPRVPLSAGPPADRCPGAPVNPQTRSTR